MFYEFESFPQNVNTKIKEICINFLKENKINYKHENCALPHGASKGLYWQQLGHQALNLVSRLKSALSLALS